MGTTAAAYSCVLAYDMSDCYLHISSPLIISDGSFQCSVGNDSKQCDGKVWLECLQDIVEINGRQTSEPLCPSAFKGDAVKFARLLKGGRIKPWNGVVVRSLQEER